MRIAAASVWCVLTAWRAPGYAANVNPASAATVVTVASQRARLRALAIAVVLLVQCTGATPRDPFNAERLARPEGERLVTWIEQALALGGMHPQRDAIVRALIDWSERGVSARNAVLAPFEAFFRHTGTHQQWGLFIAPKRESFRIQVEARPARGAYAVLYRAPGPGADPQLDAWLHYRRLRAIYNPSTTRGVRGEYPGFVRWLAGQIFARHPEYDAVRVRMERIRIGEPGTQVTGIGFEHEIVRHRGQRG